MKKYKDITTYLYISPLKTKKYRAIFYNAENDEKIRHTDFGAKGYSDFTIHGQEKRKQAYLNRHKKREDWNDPFSAGALSKWVLWNKTSLESSWKDYKKHFGFKNA